MKPLPAVLLLCGVLLAGCSGEGADRDRDGVLDAQETTGWDIEVTGLDGKATTRRVTSDPENRTTDGTLLLDTYKYALGLDPRLPDTDGDGLLDCQEVYHSVRADCLNPTFSGATDQGLRTIATRADTDGDGLADGVEVEGFGVPRPDGSSRLARTDPLRPDSDGDGLPDGLERDLHADPEIPDTDADGCRDGRDVFPTVDARLRPGLGNLTWTGDQAAKLQLQFALGSDFVTWPEQPLQFQPGQRIDLAALPQPLLKVDCTFSSVKPWLTYFIVAHWLDAPGGQRAVSLTQGPFTDAVTHYNPRTGTFALDLVGTGDRPGPFRATGPQTLLELAPSAVTTGGAVLQGE